MRSRKIKQKIFIQIDVWLIESEWRIYASVITIIGLDNRLSPGRCQTIIWTNDGMDPYEQTPVKF